MRVGEPGGTSFRRWRLRGSCGIRTAPRCGLWGRRGGWRRSWYRRLGFRWSWCGSGQLKNVSAATRVRTMLDVPLGVLRCIGLVRSFKPDVVVGVGGYASGPAMMAAIMLRVPTLAYEPNAVPGMANRLVGKYVSAAAVNFPETTKYFRNATATGVPVRDEIFAVPDRLLGPARRLLITAGSNGAKIFNETLPGIAARLLERVPGLTIVHQTGERTLAATREAYRNARVDPGQSCG